MKPNKEMLATKRMTIVTGWIFKRMPTTRGEIRFRSNK